MISLKWYFCGITSDRGGCRFLQKLMFMGLLFNNRAKHGTNSQNHIKWGMSFDTLRKKINILVGVNLQMYSVIIVYLTFKFISYWVDEERLSTAVRNSVGLDSFVIKENILESVFINRYMLRTELYGKIHSRLSSIPYGSIQTFCVWHSTHFLICGHQSVTGMQHFRLVWSYLTICCKKCTIFSWCM